MICGALELLNEEAKEDALKGEESSASTLSPINSEPGNNLKCILMWDIPQNFSYVCFNFFC